eukprot:scaffold11561_cov151-Cylindrotheca_fusiformis.AAC.5
MKLPQLLLLAAIVGALVWPFVFLQENAGAWEVETNAKVELLRHTLEKKTIALRTLEQGKMNEGNNSSDDEDPSDLPTDDLGALKEAVHKVLDTLPVNHNDTRYKPLILRNFIRRRGSGLNKTDVVLVTQMNAKKFPNYLIQIEKWNGPASVAIYIRGPHDVNRFFYFLNRKKNALSKTTFHLVVERTKLSYPTNVLRNVALEAVETNYFVALDVDLIPYPQDCHDKMVAVLPKLDLENKPKTLYVLPAFSVFPKKYKNYAKESMLPSDKEDVKKMIKNQTMGQFWKRYAIRGHKSTRNEIWLKPSTEGKPSYEISITFEDSLYYEPYVLATRPGIPRYWEDFRGYGRNKVSFNHELFLAGYTYEVLYDFFCVHLDHPLDLKLRNANQDEAWKTWRDFQSDYLWVKYNRTGAEDREPNKE